MDDELYYELQEDETIRLAREEGVNYRCTCGSELFYVFRSGDYETSARCPVCSTVDVIACG